MKTWGKYLFILWIVGLLVGCQLTEEEQKSEETMDETAPELLEGKVNQMDGKYRDILSEEFKRIHERGKLVVAMFSQDRFPYFYVDQQGNLQGSDVDMAKDIAHKIGVSEVEFDRSAQTYEEVIALVATQKVDLAISKISITSHRAQAVFFSEPYLTLSQALLINRVEFSKFKSKNTDTLKVLQLHKAKVGVVANTSWQEFASELFLQSSIKPYENSKELLAAVQSGEIIAAYYDEVEFKLHMKNHPEASIDLQIVELENRKDFLAIAIPPESQQIQEWLSHYFTSRMPLDVDQMINMYNSP